MALTFRDYYTSDLHAFLRQEQWGTGLFTAGIGAFTYAIVELRNGKPSSETISSWIALVPAGIGLFALVFLLTVNRRTRETRERLEWCLQRPENDPGLPPPGGREVRKRGFLGYLSAFMPVLFGLVCSLILGATANGIGLIIVGVFFTLVWAVVQDDMLLKGL